MFENVPFIEFPEEFHYEYRDLETSPIFRKKINLKREIKKAVITVCGLGYGYYYINGKIMTEDLFTAPTSDYNKTLWYNTYDVTDKLLNGENLIAVILGNGFYNETLHTVWDNNKASWRGLPKFCLDLFVEFADGTSEHIITDESWLCSKDSPVLFNQLRSGEVYDARIGEQWRQVGFDDTNWVNARKSSNIPKGTFRLCECEPIRKDIQYHYKNVFKNSVGNWVLDFGQNISGFIHIKTVQTEGKKLVLKHAERLNSDGTIDFNGMNSTYYFQNGEFQIDKVICANGITEWEPRFTYHGFRYLEIEGLEDEPTPEEFIAIFVHQDIADTSEFNCSDEILNKLFNMAKISVWSNLFYIPTDCPTREKFGWANDAQASCEQLLQNFDIYKMFRKWLQDIFDAMLPDGALPGIIPSHGWGYEWGAGPISTGVIFEYPYQMYRYTDNSEPIKSAYPYMLKHLDFINNHIDKADGLIGYGLCDWAGPFDNPENAPTPLKFTDTLLAIKFHRITIKAAKLCGDDKMAKTLVESEAKLVADFKKAYIFEDGHCSISEQTALSMIIVLGVYDKLEPLKEQLRIEVEKYEFHIHCGMLGFQYLFNALDICGLSEYGVRIMTSDGFPSYKEWIKDGATTLYEHWNKAESNNHHMYSCFLAWFNKTLVGFRLDEKINAYKHAIISPAFVPQLDFCFGKYKTKNGEYSVSWKRADSDKILLDIKIPEGCSAELKISGYRIENNLPNIQLNSGSYSISCLRSEYYE